MKKWNLKINNLSSAKKIWSQDSCQTQQHLIFFELIDYAAMNKKDRVCSLFT